MQNDKYPNHWIGFENLEKFHLPKQKKSKLIDLSLALFENIYDPEKDISIKDQQPSLGHIKLG